MKFIKGNEKHFSAFYSSVMKNAFSGWGYPLASCSLITMSCLWLPMESPDKGV